MSLYNLLHGMNPLADLYLAMLGLTRNDVPRFRDVYLYERKNGEGYGIAVHTRTGGGNRDMYEHEEAARSNYPEYFDGSDTEPRGPWNADLRRSAHFLYDEDDDFDCTYATFFYAVPPAFREQVNELVALGGQTDVPADAWQRLFSKLGALKPGEDCDSETQHWLEVGQPIVERITRALQPEPEPSEEARNGD